MAKIAFPPLPHTEGMTATNGVVTLKYTAGAWKAEQQYTAGSGGGTGGGLSAEQVGIIVDERVGELELGMSSAAVDAAIDTKIGELELGMSSAAVDAAIDTKIGELELGMSSAAVNTAIDTKIGELELGTMSKSNLIVSTNDPDNAVGKDGDFWLKTGA